MSRFRPRISPSGEAIIPSRSVAAFPAHAPQARFDQPTQGSVGAVRPAELRASPVQLIGFLVLCAYMVSWILNEWMLRLAGTKAYVSVITLFALPLVWLASAAVFRGLSHPIGRCWAAFLLILLLDTPFSIWRGGSFDLLINYIPRCYLLFFYVTALSVTFRECRALMYVNVAVSFGALLTCAGLGKFSEDGRYFVPGGAGFFANSNELALQLLMGITQFVYLFSQRGILRKVVSAAGIFGSVLFILRTGSRGCVVAAFVYCALLVYTSRHRIRALAIMFALLVVGLLFVPSTTLHRIMLLAEDESQPALSGSSAVASQMSRIVLLKRSISETIRHPLFGVGPGQFPVAVFEEAKEKGEWVQWLGTHNAYTQVSSECGLPALGCYIAVVVLCFVLNLRLWKVSRDLRDGADWSTLALALLSGTVVYAVGSFFFHMAYSGTLPLLAGQTLALHLAAKQRLHLGEGGLPPTVN